MALQTWDEALTARQEAPAGGKSNWLLFAACAAWCGAGWWIVLASLVTLVKGWL
ncbi:MAG: hypothetical protein ACLPWF_04680 [Bryobacteraceae bacterium]